MRGREPIVRQEVQDLPPPAPTAAVAAAATETAADNYANARENAHARSAVGYGDWESGE